MNNFFTTLIYGKDNRLSGLLALGLVGAVALGCTCGKNFDLANAGKDNGPSNSSNPTSDSPFSGKDSDGSIPSPSTLQAMVKETTSDFAQAVETGDFSEIYSKASTDFQNTYSEDQMKNVFKTFIDKKSQVLPSLSKAASTEAEFSPAPSIRTEQGLPILVLNGKFPTKPNQVRFEYEYVLRGGEWKMLKLVVKM
jgi:hypothetical protein